MQAGASEVGPAVRGETAEVVFARRQRFGRCEGASTPTSKGGPEKLGRYARADRRSCRPRSSSWATPMQEAQDKRARLDSLVHYDSAICVPVHHARLRRVGLRPRRSAAGNSADQRKPHGPGTDDRAREGREPQRPAARATARRLRRAVVRGHRGDDRRSDGAVAGRGGLGRLQHHVSVPAGRSRGFRRARWFRSCSGADCSAASTRARLCARTSGSSDRRIASSRSRERWCFRTHHRHFPAVNAEQ